jgi:hypothetical protein
MSKSKMSSNFFKDMLQIANVIDSKSLERAAGVKLSSIFLSCPVQCACEVPPQPGCRYAHHGGDQNSETAPALLDEKLRLFCLE